jgi:sRNA-binding protein
MTYRPTREESEHVIRMLCEAYPKTFFEDPRLRRPIKRNIAADLQEDGFAATYELVMAAVDWYQGHYGYLKSLQAGSKRVDLTGKMVDTVTEQEQQNAQKRMQEIHELNKIRNPVNTLSMLYAANKIPDDQIRKLDAPPMPARKPSQDIAPELSRLYAALMAANTTLMGGQDEALRIAMTKAALGVVVSETQAVIGGL